MHHIRKSYTRAFQNIQNYSKPNCNDGERPSKIKYFLLEEAFPKNTNIWENQAIQREFLLKSLDFADSDDYICFSDPDEIPRPEIFINLFPILHSS